MQRKFDSAAMERFLDTLASTHEVAQAAQAAGVSMTTVYWHRRHNPSFGAAWKTALDYDENLLRWVALGRIQEGQETPIYYRGEKIGTVKKHNDTLLVQLLRMQERRRERREKQDAAQAAPARDELSELLELIDGTTRSIHAE
jgi:hypothetical protein